MKYNLDKIKLDKSNLKWTRIAPIDTNFVFSEEEVYYWLGYNGVDLVPAYEIDGSLYFVNNKREVIAVWRRDDEELDIYVKPKRKMNMESRSMIFAVGMFLIFLIALGIVEKLNSQQFVVLWLLGIVAFFIFMGGNYFYRRFIKKERW